MDALRDVAGVIVGKDQTVKLAPAALLNDGHVLITARSRGARHPVAALRQVVSLAELRAAGTSSPWPDRLVGIPLVGAPRGPPTFGPSCNAFATKRPPSDRYKERRWLRPPDEPESEVAG